MLVGVCVFLSVGVKVVEYGVGVDKLDIFVFLVSFCCLCDLIFVFRVVLM